MFSFVCDTLGHQHVIQSGQYFMLWCHHGLHMDSYDPLFPLLLDSNVAGSILFFENLIHEYN